MSWLTPLMGLGPRVIELTIGSNTNSYNIFTAAGEPSEPVVVILTINSGVRVGSSSASFPSIQTGSGWNALSSLKMINKGLILGRGGNGGAGGDTSNPNGRNGVIGGTAFELDYDIEVDNASGEIRGGGGGGGGGGLFGVSGNNGGGGGGGGRGVADSAGGLGGVGNDCTGSNGNVGNFLSAGTGGAGCPSAGSGGNGGDWATAGLAGGAGDHSAGTGGDGGKAVELNGNTLTWIDMGTVVGAVS